MYNTVQKYQLFFLLSSLQLFVLSHLWATLSPLQIFLTWGLSQTRIHRPLAFHSSSGDRRPTVAMSLFDHIQLDPAIARSITTAIPPHCVTTTTPIWSHRLLASAAPFSVLTTITTNSSFSDELTNNHRFFFHLNLNRHTSSSFSDSTTIIMPSYSPVIWVVAGVWQREEKNDKVRGKKREEVHMHKEGMILQNCPCTLKGITKNTIGIVFVSQNLCLFIIIDS